MSFSNKFSHLSGKPFSIDLQYHDLDVASSPHDGRIIAANMLWIAVASKHTSLAPIAILSHGATGRLKTKIPLLFGHTGAITDMAWNPFHEWMLASAATDDSLILSKLPEHGITNDSNQPAESLRSQGKRINTIAWHPTAVNVLASGDITGKAKIWDIQQFECEKLNMSCSTSQVDSLSWNYDGSQIAIVSRDMMLRIGDIRSGNTSINVKSHAASNKSQRVSWLGDSSFVLTTGFSQHRDRECKLWDLRSPSKCLKTQVLDSNQSSAYPFYDLDTRLLFLSGRGDGTIRIFHHSHDSSSLTELASISDSATHHGIAMLPKRICQVMQCEVVRLYRALDKKIIPIGFQVPRKSHMTFHADLYPDTPGIEPALDEGQWFAGENARPILVSLDPSKGFSEMLQEEDHESAMGEKIGPQSQPPHKRNILDQYTGIAQPVTKVEYYTPKEVKCVRSSHYRHIIGKMPMKTDHYHGINVFHEAMQNKLIDANQKWIAVSWQATGSDCIAVLSVEKDRGATLPKVGLPTISAGSRILDFSWNPFDCSMLTTAGENGLIKLWQVPPQGLSDNLQCPSTTLHGHNQKVTNLLYHPVASNILLSSSGDLSLKVWDIETQQASLTCHGHQTAVSSMTWNYDGTLFAGSSRDKLIRIWDPRQNVLVTSFPDLGSVNGSKLVWLSDHANSSPIHHDNHLLIVGANRNNQYIIQVVDTRNPSQVWATHNIGNCQTQPIPHFDPDTGLLLLWGKGESSIKLFELNEDQPMIHRLTDYQSNVPQLGISIVHKTQVDISEIEVLKTFKLTNKSIEPLGFYVPRMKKDCFQDDIYCDTPALEPTLTSRQWLSGETKPPRLVSLRPEGMPLKSQVKSTTMGVRRSIIRTEREPDVKDVKDRLLKQLGQMKTIDGDPNANVDGVGEDEWDD